MCGLLLLGPEDRRVVRRLQEFSFLLLGTFIRVVIRSMGGLRCSVLLGRKGVRVDLLGGDRGGVIPL